MTALHLALFLAILAAGGFAVTVIIHAVRNGCARFCAKGEFHV